eukprot:Gb_24742 [translate_table: standard]
MQTTRRQRMRYAAWFQNHSACAFLRFSEFSCNGFGRKFFSGLFPNHRGKIRLWLLVPAPSAVRSLQMTMTMTTTIMEIKVMGKRSKLKLLEELAEEEDLRLYGFGSQYTDTLESAHGHEHLSKTGRLNLMELPFEQPSLWAFGP